MGRTCKDVMDFSLAICFVTAMRLRERQDRCYPILAFKITHVEIGSHERLIFGSGQEAEHPSACCVGKMGRTRSCNTSRRKLQLESTSMILLNCRLSYECFLFLRPDWAALAVRPYNPTALDAELWQDQSCSLSRKGPMRLRE